MTCSMLWPLPALKQSLSQISLDLWFICKYFVSPGRVTLDYVGQKEEKTLDTKLLIVSSHLGLQSQEVWWAAVAPARDQWPLTQAATANSISMLEKLQLFSCVISGWPRWILSPARQPHWETSGIHAVSFWVPMEVQTRSFSLSSAYASFSLFVWVRVHQKSLQVWQSQKYFNTSSPVHADRRRNGNVSFPHQEIHPRDLGMFKWRQNQLNVWNKELEV